jgi:hypothetical protein
MAAGQGFKTFVTGEVLTAGDVNGYLMQGINVFTNATARDAAITAPAEGQFAFTKDNNSLWYYDGAAWVASGATGDIEGVTAGVGISGGGTSGTVTVTNSMATAIDAKGDLVPGTGADTFARLAVGANDTVLTADSTAATGLKWAAVGSGGETLLSTTSITAASTITVGSISTAYNSLRIVIQDMAISSPNEFINFRVNGVSAANYAFNCFQSSSGGVSYTGDQGSSAIRLANQYSSASNTNDGIINIYIPQYANTVSYKTLTYSTQAIGSSQSKSWMGSGGINETPAITSISILVTAGTFTAQGSILIYGVK